MCLSFNAFFFFHLSIESEYESDARKLLQNQIDEKERRLNELREQAILQQNIYQANQQASTRTTPQQLAAMKRKAQMDTLRKTDGKSYRL